MFSLRLIGLLCFLASANCAVYEVEDSVLLLNDSNFEQAIKDHKLLFVMFYLPFVDDCQAMAPEFAKAAKQLEDAGSGIKLAKVYASFEGHLSWEYVRGIPTLMFYREGQLVRAFVDSAQVAVVGFFKNQTSVEAKEFLKACFDDRNTTLDMPITSESVQKFVQQNSLPLVVDFTNQNAPDVFSWPTRQYNVLFYSNKSADFEEVLANFRKAAAAFQHQVLFVTIDADNENSKYILWLFFVAEHEVPAQRFVNFQVDFMRYKPRTASLKAEDIKTFVQDVLDGKIKEGMPPLDLLGDSEAHPVELNVDDNFEEVVYDITKDVLVQYYTPQCPRCKLLVPMYEALAEKYKNRKDVVIAKIDITTNEVERIVVHYLPVFKLYKKNTNAVSFRACVLLGECCFYKQFL
ncbi:hypothetical protein HPB51_002130 [Rhipicephalus microplus]|uniref:Thioredoxin domain-containing protein n=1 Tax=Rhipicephalus microplus TaxID=6941 RepID=A0A9J6ERB7_RHIMP|nr:hypothetical protein HPB51_002130 [Rhipicephalus microplus]